MNDFLPPNRRPVARPLRPATPASPPATPPPVQKPAEPQTPVTMPDPSLILDDSVKPSLAPKKRGKAKWIVSLIVVVLVSLAGAAAYCYSWYQGQLLPFASSEAERVRVTIESGLTPDQIGKLLEEKKVIRSSLAFDIYTKLEGETVRGGLQAGTYNLSPADSTQAVVSHILQGKTDEFSITFLPGATLADHRAALVRSGYSAEEVDAALAKEYDHPVFADKPATADLEGYIYGETYNFTSDATVEDILTRTFDELESVIEENNLVEAYKAQNLNLYQGITLASIIQREVSGAADQKQVSQVFLRRLSIDMPLGADATFVYAAKKLGVDPSVSLDSPYNTRVVNGLPPGPISSPGASALIAVGSPAQGDYLYFVSGDDGTNYFSRTLEEHEANTRTYCQKNCSLF